MLRGAINLAKPPLRGHFFSPRERFQTNCSLVPQNTLAMEAAELLSPRLAALHKHQTHFYMSL